MGLAETAQLAVALKLEGGAAFTAGMKEAQAATSSFGTSALAGVASGLSKVGGAVGKVEGALGHAKKAIGGLLTGPLGVLGLGAGVFSLGTIIEQTISKTTDFAYAVEKFSEVTGLAATQASTLLAVFEKFNVDATSAAQIAGFAEKTIGKLAETQGKAGKSTALLALEQRKLTIEEAGGKTAAINKAIAEQKAADALAAGATGVSKLVQLDHMYGITLVDTKGKVVDFQTELYRVADYYTSSASASQKAALAATLFGRGYATIVPILALGSKGIQEAQQAASSLGLVLTAQNATDLKNYREGMRDLGDAASGLQLQIGLALIPSIEGLAKSLTTFISEHRTDIVQFFKEAAQNVGEFAHFLSNDVVPALLTIGTAAKSAWDAIPAGLKDLLIKGFVANKTVKFLFGIDIAGDIGSALQGALSKAVGTGIASAGLGKLFVQPVFVTNPGFGAGGLPGAGGTPIAPVTAAEDVANQVKLGIRGAFVLGAGAGVAADQGSRLLNPQDPLYKSLNAAWQQGHPGQQVFGSMEDFGHRILMHAPPLPNSGPNPGYNTPGGDLDSKGNVRGAAAFAAILARDLVAAARKAEDAWEAHVGGKAGVAARSLAKYGHAASAGSISATLVRDELHHLAVIEKSNLDNATKLARLKALAEDLKAHGDTKTAKTVQKAIDDMKTKVAAATDSVKTTVASGTNTLDEAIRSWDQSLAVTVQFSASDVNKTQTKKNRYGNTDPTHPGAR